MSVCGHRPEACGFFTPCHGCACGQEVGDELTADGEAIND